MTILQLRHMPCVAESIPPALAGHGTIEIVGVSGGCYLFANDGSEVDAWISWSAPRAPGRSVEAVAHWLGSQGVPCYISGRSMTPAPVCREPKAAAPAPVVEPKPPKLPKNFNPDQMDMF